MTAPAVAPVVLTAEDARRLTARIRDALALADDLLAQAYAGRAWEALGHADWPAFCAAELPELRHVKLRTPERRARVAALLAANPDATVRDLVAGTGSSLGTIHTDLTVLRGVAAPVVVRTRAQQVVDEVAKRGTKGMTIPQLSRALGIRDGAASGALSRLERQGRVRRDGRFRDGFGVYVAT